ncbi:hypothetical protein DFH06DRAFT_976275, partial [Mycena polygramma]
DSNGTSLRHLFCFKNLVDVTLGHPFDLRDREIVDLASSWPYIKFLTFSGAGHYNEAPLRLGVTLLGLYAFAQHCPNLCCLAISVDATGTAGLESNGSEEPACQTALTALDLQGSSIATAAPVAAFILATFPNVENIEFRYADGPSSDGEEATYIDHWLEVNRLLEPSAGGEHASSS